MLHALFAVWMTLSPETMAAAIGYEAPTASGRSAFLAIYGGLQLGPGAFFALLAARHTVVSARLLFALCLYVPIVLYRVIIIGRLWPV